MSASPQQEVKPVAPDVEEDEQPVKAATPVADDNDNNDGEVPEEEEEQAKPAQGSPAADGDLAENEDKDDDDEVDGGGGSDDESILSEVDEAQFEDFDPENVDVDDRPQLAIDEENLKLVGRHKRKRTEEGDGERASRRKKEGRREKKSRRMKDLEEGGEGEDEEGKSRKREKKKRDATPEDEELLDPETRMFSQCFDTFGRDDEYLTVDL